MANTSPGDGIPPLFSKPVLAVLRQTRRRNFTRAPALLSERPFLAPSLRVFLVRHSEASGVYRSVSSTVAVAALLETHSMVIVGRPKVLI